MPPQTITNIDQPTGGLIGRGEKGEPHGGAHAIHQQYARSAVYSGGLGGDACAIESKIHAIERGFYDEGPGEEWPGLASNSAWILHLHEILEKLGPDGVFAVEDGVLPVQDPDAG